MATLDNAPFVSAGPPRCPVPATASNPRDEEGRRIRGQGTPEAAWRLWDGLSRLARLDIAHMASTGGRIVVVAPHPDDEVLGCGGALALLARAGRAIHVVGVTDGEASYAGSRRWPPELLGITRRSEREAGLARLGQTLASVSLEIPDGQVAAFEDELATAVERTLRPGDTVLTTWRFDGHPDHEAAGRAASQAAAKVGCRCWEMPVWMWHWAEPGDARVPWERLHRLDLGATASHAKCQAIAAHASQLQPIRNEGRQPVLPDWALARLLRPFETFFDQESIA